MKEKVLTAEAINEKLEERKGFMANCQSLIDTEDDETFLSVFSTIPDFPVGYASAEKAMALISGKWKYAILRRIFIRRCMRYSELKKSLEPDGITDNMLASSLKEMVQAGLLTKTIYAEVPARVEYAITPKAIEMYRIILRLAMWYITYEKKELQELLEAAETEAL
ncbi:helix-turn-helix domain-containing protein [Eubacterium sp. 1001713B170207_170306_E7]|uniref:winged helix-turn-helix transcriptional regulator n=1 Tax=Eubacterium sp. 1001713B170207_170306_E7 TaxID=2787097 RepID=UPI00189949EA|nr:helix-turn-helix domain-containing protein [Eubacterium sp. 1001713B170207_170306_E7]